MSLTRDNENSLVAKPKKRKKKKQINIHRDHRDERRIQLGNWIKKAENNAYIAHAVSKNNVDEVLESGRILSTEELLRTKHKTSYVSSFEECTQDITKLITDEELKAQIQALPPFFHLNDISISQAYTDSLISTSENNFMSDLDLCSETSDMPIILANNETGTIKKDKVANCYRIKGVSLLTLDMNVLHTVQTSLDEIDKQYQEKQYNTYLKEHKIYLMPSHEAIITLEPMEPKTFYIEINDNLEIAYSMVTPDREIRHVQTNMTIRPLKELMLEQLKDMTLKQLEDMTKEQLEGMTQEQLEGMTQEQLKNMTLKQLEDMKKDILAHALKEGHIQYENITLSPMGAAYL